MQTGKLTQSLMLWVVLALLLPSIASASTLWYDPSLSPSDRLIQYRLWAEHAETRLNQVHGTPKPTVGQVASTSGHTPTRVVETAVVKTEGVKGSGVASGSAARGVGATAGTMAALTLAGPALEYSVGSFTYWHADGTQCSDPIGWGADPLCNLEHFAYVSGGPFREEGWQGEEPPLFDPFAIDAEEADYPEVYTLLESHPGPYALPPATDIYDPEYTVAFGGGGWAWATVDQLQAMHTILSAIAAGQTLYQFGRLDGDPVVADWTEVDSGSNSQTWDISANTYLVRVSDGTRSPYPIGNAAYNLIYDEDNLIHILGHTDLGSYGTAREANGKWLLGLNDGPWMCDPVSPEEGIAAQDVDAAPIRYPDGGSMNRSFNIPADTVVDGDDTVEDVAGLYIPSPIPEPVQEAIGAPDPDPNEVGAPNPDPNENVNVKQSIAALAWTASEKWPFAGASVFYSPSTGGCTADGMEWDLDLPVAAIGGQPSRDDITVPIAPITWAEALQPYRWLFTAAVAIGWLLGMLVLLRPRVHV